MLNSTANKACMKHVAVYWLNLKSLPNEDLISVNMLSSKIAAYCV